MPLPISAGLNCMTLPGTPSSSSRQSQEELPPVVMPFMPLEMRDVLMMGEIPVEILKLYMAPPLSSGSKASPSVEPV